MIQVLGDRHRRDAGVGFVDGAACEGFLVGADGRGGHGVHDVEVTGLEVVVGGVHRLVELDEDTLVLGLLVTNVVLVGNQVDLDVVLPGVLRGELVGAVADRVLAAGLGVVQGRVRQRRVGGVAQAAEEVVAGCLQRDREGVVVDDLDAGQVAHARLVGAFEVAEEGGLLLVLRGDELPGAGEVLSLDGGPVGELTVLVDLDGPDGVVVVGLDGLGDVEDGVAVNVVAHELAEDLGQDLTAAGFGGLAGQQRVLRLGAVEDDGVGVDSAGAGSQCERSADGNGEPCLLQVHGYFLLIDGRDRGRCPRS